MENFAEQLETLTRQEQELQFTAFTSDIALALGLKVIEIVHQRGKVVTVNITVNGKVLFHHAMQGAAADQADWIRRKNNVVERFGRSSYFIGIDHKHRGVAFDEIKYLPPQDYAELYKPGAEAIFPPGTVIADAAEELIHKLNARLGHSEAAE